MKAHLARVSVLLFACSTPTLSHAQCPFSLAPAVNFAVGSQPVYVATGDFNADGRPDLAVANDGSNSVSILLAIAGGGGTFESAVHYAVGTNPFSVATGDFNADGLTDLAVANASFGGIGSVSILLGSIGGSFQPATNYSAGSNPVSVAVGDFDADGNSDLAVANIGSHNVSILLGTGTGTFPAAVSYPVGTSPRSLAVGDFNGDGRSDVATANLNSGNVSVLLGNSNGTFQPATHYPAGEGPHSLAVGDFNADGRPDLSVANYRGRNDVYVLLGGANGVFQQAVSYGAGAGPFSVAVGDLNGDGRLDVAAGNYNSNDVSILVGNPGGTFQTAVNSVVGTRPISVAVSDFNADGWLDLAVANQGGNSISVLVNSSPNALVSQQPTPASTCPAGTASFSVTVTGNGPFTYRWQRETAPGQFVNLSNGRTTWDSCGGSGLVFGSTTRTLVIVADIAGGLTLCQDHAVRYRCVVTGSCGSVTSDASRLVVCEADFNCDGFLDFFDYDSFVECYETEACGDGSADFNGDGFIDFFDYDDFVAAFETGC